MEKCPTQIRTKAACNQGDRHRVLTSASQRHYGDRPIPGANGAPFYLNERTSLAVRDGEILFRGTGIPIIQGI